jgi:hypothetical protein
MIIIRACFVVFRPKALDTAHAMYAAILAETPERAEKLRENLRPKAFLPKKRT